MPNLAIRPFGNKIQDKENDLIDPVEQYNRLVKPYKRKNSIREKKKRKFQKLMKAVEKKEKRKGNIKISLKREPPQLNTLDEVAEEYERTNSGRIAKLTAIDPSF